jgi:beta-galactosidase
VWAIGRVNYGPKMLDHKGISDRVEFKHLTLANWEIYPLPMNSPQFKTLRFANGVVGGPTLYRGEFTLAEHEVGDTFLDTRGLEIGALWVNGHNLGRFWSIGPQQTLFCPGCWLRAGENEVLVFDLCSNGRPVLAGLDHAVLNDVRER